MKNDFTLDTANQLILSRDEQLIADCLAGSEKAFSALMGFYKKRVEALGYSFFHNATDTEDFVQEVFLKAYTHLATFRGESKFSTWLLRIAYTTALNTKKNGKTYETLADEVELPAPTDSPEEIHLREVTRLAVKEAVQELPWQYAVSLDLYFFYDMSYDEISVITGQPLNTVRSNIFRAKKILRTKLRDLITEQ